LGISKESMKHVTIAVLAFASLSAAAEVIDGPANVRDIPNGRVLFSLDDKVLVESGKSENEWLNIQIPVYVDVNGSFADGAKTVLNKSVKLYDERGTRIGITLEKVKAEPFFDEDVHNGRKIVVLKGITHRQNIRQDSILELQLGGALNASTTLSLEDFRDHLKSFHYKEWMPRANFLAYIQFNDPTTDPTPWPRAILFFYEGKLIAVYHGKPVPSSRITASAKIRGDTMSYVTGVAPELRKKFSAIYYPIIEGAD